MRGKDNNLIDAKQETISKLQNWRDRRETESISILQTSQEN